MMPATLPRIGRRSAERVERKWKALNTLDRIDALMERVLSLVEEQADDGEPE